MKCVRSRVQAFARFPERGLQRLNFRESVGCLVYERETQLIGPLSYNQTTNCANYFRAPVRSLSAVGNAAYVLGFEPLDHRFEADPIANGKRRSLYCRGQETERPRALSP